MMMIRQRKLTFALLVVLLMFAACKGESPTNPTTGGGTTSPGGGTTPPTGATVTLTVSNPNPLVSSTTTVTATVTVNGSAVANGTAVEFAVSSPGSFSTSATVTSQIQTTTGGVASITVTAPSVGPVVVSAVVNNVQKTTTITFQAQASGPPPPPNTTPTITGIIGPNGVPVPVASLPVIVNPSGGQQFTISGTNFRPTVRVIFDFGSGIVKDASVVSVSPTAIVALTPPINVGIGAMQAAGITVVDNANTASEVRTAELANAFSYQSATLTPSITTVSPSSGPINGGTRVTIFGSGFQAPVQVFFGSAAASVVTINFAQIIAISPTASATTGNGSGSVTGPVDIKVININSATNATLTSAFSYTPKMQITAIGPGQGSAFGGTRVTTDGIGFVDPVTIGFAGIPAAAISVAGTEIVALTGATPIPCTPPTGAVQVVNVNNGDSASGPSFAYAAEIPAITGVSPAAATPGSNVSITVQRPGVGVNPPALIKFTIGGITIFPSPSSITDPRGPINFTAVVPPAADFTFPTMACTVGGVGGTVQLSTAVDVLFTNVNTGCTDTASKALTVLPPPPNTCVATTPVPPPAAASVSPVSLCPNSFGSVTVGSSSTQQVIVSNTAAAGSQSLMVTTNIAGGNSADFVANPTTLTLTPGQSLPITITFTPSATGARTSTLSLFTNDPNHNQINVCLGGTGM